MYRPQSWHVNEWYRVNPSDGEAYARNILLHKKRQLQRAKCDWMKWQYEDNIKNGQDVQWPESYKWLISAKSVIEIYPTRARYGPNYSMVMPGSQRYIVRIQQISSWKEEMDRTALKFKYHCRRPKKNWVIHWTKDSVSTEYLAKTVIVPRPTEGTHTAGGVAGTLSLPQFHSVATLA